MKRCFPIWRRKPPTKWAVGEAMMLNMKPAIGSVHANFIPFPSPATRVIRSIPVILTFPVRAL